MNRIDFHSIATILLGGLIDADYSQMDFIYMLFGSFANDNVDFAFDNGLVCKWIKGQSRISPKIISYYNIEKNRDKFCKDIESKLLPYISDVSYAISAIRDLMLCDITTSDEKKDALLTHFDHAPAHFICDVLVYGFSRNFVKARNKDSCSSSPRVDDVMYLPLLPKPTKYFTGRSNALLELHQLLYIPYMFTAAQTKASTINNITTLSTVESFIKLIILTLEVMRTMISNSSISTIQNTTDLSFRFQ